MLSNEAQDAFKDVIVDDVSKEHFHRTGGDTRHLLPSVETMLGAIVAAFLLPYLKKLAERAADATWSAVADRKSATQLKRSDVEGILAKGSAADHEEAARVSAESVRACMEEHRFSDATQNIVIEKLTIEVRRMSRMQ